MSIVSDDPLLGTVNNMSCIIIDDPLLVSLRASADVSLVVADAGERSRC